MDGIVMDISYFGMKISISNYAKSYGEIEIGYTSRKNL